MMFLQNKTYMCESIIFTTMLNEDFICRKYNKVDIEWKYLIRFTKFCNCTHSHRITQYLKLLVWKKETKSLILVDKKRLNFRLVAKIFTDQFFYRPNILPQGISAHNRIGILHFSIIDSPKNRLLKIKALILKTRRMQKLHHRRLIQRSTTPLLVRPLCLTIV